MSQIKISNQRINSRPPGFTLAQSRIAAEVNEALHNYDITKLAQSPGNVLMSKHGNYVRKGKQPVIVGVAYKNLLPDGDTNYSWLKKAAFGMMNKYYESGGNKIPFVIGVQPYEFDDETGTAKGTPGVIELGIAHEAVTFFKSLEGGFTPDGKHIALNANCKYSPLMADYLRQFSHDGHSFFRIAELQELRKVMGVAEGVLERWDDFKKNVLARCQSDLADTSEAFDFEIPPGGKGGKNGKQVVKVLLRLRNAPVKIKGDQTVKQTMKLFWSKYAPGGTLAVSAALLPIIDNIKNTSGAHGELLVSNYKLTEQQVVLIFSFLEPEEIWATLQQVTNFNDTWITFEQKYPKLLTDFLVTKFKMKPVAAADVCARLTTDRIREGIKAFNKTYTGGKRHVDDVGAALYGVFRNRNKQAFNSIEAKETISMYSLADRQTATVTAHAA